MKSVYLLVVLAMFGCSSSGNPSSKILSQGEQLDSGVTDSGVPDSDVTVDAGSDVAVAETGPVDAGVDVMNNTCCSFCQDKYIVCYDNCLAQDASSSCAVDCNAGTFETCNKAYCNGICP
jgi:hypothetical protein